MIASCMHNWACSATSLLVTLPADLLRRTCHMDPPLLQAQLEASVPGRACQ